MSKIILRTNNLCKQYNGKPALTNVCMEIRQGAIYGFIGKNGAGKTTLMKLVCNLAAPTSGSIELFGDSTPEGLKRGRKRIGAMVETPSLYQNMTAVENMVLQKKILGAVGKEKPEELLSFVGLEETGKKKVRAFSLGMKQRLGLAVALLNNPDFLILDEPINGLDPVGIAGIRNILKRLVEDRNMTVLISSHILAELNQLANSYGIIDNGALIKQISAEKLHEECREYLKLVTSDVERCVNVLEDKLQIRNFQVLAGNEINVYEAVDKAEEIGAALFAAGVGVKSMSTMGQDLESYFLKLTGGGKDNE